MIRSTLKPLNFTLNIYLHNFLFTYCKEEQQCLYNYCRIDKLFQVQFDCFCLFQMSSKTHFAFLFFISLLILHVSCKKKNKKVKFFSRHHPDFKYCMDNYLFPRFFKSFCPGKGERWLKARAKVQSKLENYRTNFIYTE